MAFIIHSSIIFVLIKIRMFIFPFREFKIVFINIVLTGRIKIIFNNFIHRSFCAIVAA